VAADDWSALMSSDNDIIIYPHPLFIPLPVPIPLSVDINTKIYPFISNVAEFFNNCEILVSLLYMHLTKF
jgi:hypothetical protein